MPIDDAHVTVEAIGHVAHITLSRPAKLNAITQSMSRTLIEVAAAVDADTEIRVVLVRGLGRAFSVGSDVGELDAYASDWAFRNRRDYCDAIRAIRKPVIAAVNGLAYGGGLELALSADIRLAGASATFCSSEIKLGWSGGGGAAALLLANVAVSDAAILLMTGEPVDAEHAYRIGLVSQVTPDEDLETIATELARTIGERPPIATQTVKANLRAALSMGLEPAIQYEREMQAICFATEDAREGREAFASKRAPRFVGR